MVGKEIAIAVEDAEAGSFFRDSFHKFAGTENRSTRRRSKRFLSADR
jgi:hypothetical protein